MPAPALATPKPRKRADGRRALLVYVDQKVIKNVKKIAFDGHTTASSIAEQALQK